MYYLAVSEITIFIFTQSLFCFENSNARLRVRFVNFSSSLYRLIFGYDFPSTHHPHTIQFPPPPPPPLPALLEIIISVSGEEPLPVGGFLLQHHNHATKVAGLLLFWFFLPEKSELFGKMSNSQSSGIFQTIKS